MFERGHLQMLEVVMRFVEAKVGRVIRFAAADPGSFVLTFITYISPLMILCAVLAWKLQKAIEREQRVLFRFSQIFMTPTVGMLF